MSNVAVVEPSGQVFACGWTSYLSGGGPEIAPVVYWESLRVRRDGELIRIKADPEPSGHALERMAHHLGVSRDEYAKELRSRAGRRKSPPR
jgi:hypothetical protein